MRGRNEQRWTEKQTVQLLNMALSGSVLNREIAEYFQVKPNTISAKLKSMGVKNNAVKGIIGKWNNKHAHLRRDVLTYFLNHTAEETQKKFKLTASEFKSCMCYAYITPELRHLRKDKRRRDAWSSKEFKFMLQHTGLMPRKWIAEKLNRGGVEAIRGKLDQLNISSKSLNGLTISQFREAFGTDPDFYIQSKAGPTRGLHGDTYWKIIPWVWLAKEIKEKRLNTSESFKLLIFAMSEFQEWIYDGNVIVKMKRIVREKIPL